MSAKNGISDRTAALLEKQRELDERIKRSMSRDRSAGRKARSRALLLIGVAIEKWIKQQPTHMRSVRSMTIEYLSEREQEAVNNFLDTLLAGDSAPTSAPPDTTPLITPPPAPQRLETFNS